MNYENLKWINQSLYSFKDKSFDSHGYLEISISINTEDDVTFSQPKLVLNLDNQGQRRNIRLSISNVIDLVKTINDVRANIKNIYQNPQEGDITKRYNKDKDLVFEFRIFNNQPLVVMKIKHNISDEGKIIFSLNPEFKMIAKILENYLDNYINISMNLPSRYLNSLTVNKLNGIDRLIQILPTHFPTNISASSDKQKVASYPVESQDDVEELHYNGLLCELCGEDQFETRSGPTCKNGHGGVLGVDPQDQANEFEQFAAEEEPKVRIPELESDALEPREPIKQEFKSSFIEHTLQNNILNLEKMLLALTTNNAPLRTIMDSIYKGDGYSLLPGISEQDLKSVFYISNLYFKMNYHSYIKNQTIFPLSIPVVKYFTDEKIDRQTIELSYDLLLINAYLKIYRGRMEAVDSDPHSNGSLIHFCFRCFLDPAAFSYLNGKNSESVKSCVLSRFKYFREIGFFDHYDKNLEERNLQKIFDNQISEFIDKVFENVIDSENIDKRHFNAHDAGSVKVPPKNNFNLEQITNDIVKFEIKTLFGQRIEDLTNDEEIILFFNKKLKKKYKPTDHKPEKRKSISHVLRYIKLKANEIPENKRKDFVDYIESIGNESYDYFNNEFQLEELNDIMLKTVYKWNSYVGLNLKYTDFVLAIEDCIDRDLIISKIKEDNEPNLNPDHEEMKENGDWSDAFADIEI